MKPGVCVCESVCGKEIRPAEEGMRETGYSREREGDVSRQTVFVHTALWKKQVSRPYLPSYYPQC